MSTEDIIKNMTDEDVVDILTDLGSDDPSFVNGGMMFNTICHNSPGTGKKKLHYHYESKTFYCYTQCHNIGNIFKLVMKAKDCNFRDAYEYVCNKLSIPISTLKYGFTEAKVDNKFINKFEQKDDEIKMPEVRDSKVLKKFWPNLFHKSWIDDFISIETMKKFNIHFDVSGNRIIIPHYNENCELIGVRCRNLNKDKVDEGKKYMPIVVEDVLYNYLTSLNLYGVHINKKNIIKYKKVIIGESEKFVMQHSTYYDESIAVAISGSSIHSYQIEMLKRYGVEEVILALDKEFSNKEEEDEYMQKIQKSFIAKLCPYFKVSIIWDIDNEIDLKMSPTDKGKEIFESLYKKRLFI